MSLAESRQLLAGVVDDVLGDAGAREGTGPPASSTWATVARLGWPLVGLQEEHGGAGGSWTDLTAIAEGLGRCAARIPVVETALARWAAGSAASGWDAGDVATVAWSRGALAREDGGTGVRVSGELSTVPWASSARHLVVVGEDWAGTTELPDPDTDIEPGVNIADEPRDAVRFRDAVLQPITHPPSIASLEARLALLRAAATVGAAGSALRLSIEHVRTREQFGRPIGRFQLVGSAIAEMASELVLARSSLEAAVDAQRPDSDDPIRTAAAVLSAAHTATIVARSSHQVHGAIGITREHALHRFTRRLWAWRDDPIPERVWQRRLGRRAVSLGPEALWDLLTANPAETS